MAVYTQQISQAAFTIDSDRAFPNGIRETVRWMANRCNKSLPKHAFQGEDFEWQSELGTSAEAAFLAQGDDVVWAGRLRFAESTNHRAWVTEVILRELAGTTRFGARLSVEMEQESPIVHSRPGVIHQIVSEYSCFADGLTLTPFPIVVDSDDEFETLIKLITVDKRIRPVVVISQTFDGSSNINTKDLANRVCGLCHIFELTYSYAFQLTNRFGRQFSVFRGATRLYAVGFSPESSDPYDHPLWLGSDMDIVVRRICRETLRIRRSDFSFPRYEQVSNQRAVLQSPPVSREAVELLELFESENGKLLHKLKALELEYNQALELADVELKDAESRRDEAVAERSRVVTRVSILEERFRREALEEEIEPLSFDQIEDWATYYLSGSIWLAPRAIRTTERTEFSRPEILQNTLLFLRDSFVPWLRDKSNAALRQSYLAGLSALNLEEDACFSNNENPIKQFPQYQVTYNGVRHIMERHFKWGNAGSWDQRKYMRIYYAWSEIDSLLLIGHMPDHLPNDATRK